jgi:isopentenyldiphosphate isomerase
LNLYDAQGAVVGAGPRRAAKASGRAVGAVNALVLNGRGEVLLQKRPRDKENGGLWDKSVGGHVSAGEDFDATLLREAGEELFDDGRSGQVRLAASEDAFAELLARADLGREVVLRRIGFQRNLRDVRHAPEGGVRNVLYHVAVYAGRTEMPAEGFRPQKSEIDALGYHNVPDVDRMLLAGLLAPNMAFLWLVHGYDLCGFAAAGGPGP